MFHIVIFVDQIYVKSEKLNIIAVDSLLADVLLVLNIQNLKAGEVE